MGFLLFLALLGASLATCAAVLIAFEARRLCDPRRFRIALVCAVPLAACTSAMVVVASQNQVFDRRRSGETGFGPDWHCLTWGRKGGDFCFREPAKRDPP